MDAIIKKIPCAFALFLVTFATLCANAHSATAKNLATNCIDGLIIESVDFDGLLHTKPHVVEREMLNSVGKTFSATNFETEKLKLLDLDLFTEISLTCKHTNNGEILHYNFKEIFRWIPSPAGKKTDRDGLMLGLALANLNVLGDDIRAEVQYRTAVDPFLENNEYAFYASSPYLFNLPLGWNFEFLRTDSWDDLRNFDDASFLFDLDLNFKISTNFSLLATAAFRYLQNGPGALPEAGGGFAVDFRDRELDTRNGIYAEYMLTHIGAGGYMGENFWEMLLDLRAYNSIWKFVTGATALVRYRPGDILRYDYFYHGGANTFRGHDADPLYLGKHETLVTLEERFILIERHAVSIFGINLFYGVQLVAGFDGSLLWSEGTPDWSDYEGAVYGGIHLVIPALDRIRFEVGYSPDNGEPVFYIGLFDKTTSSRWRSR